MGKSEDYGYWDAVISTEDEDIDDLGNLEIAEAKSEPAAIRRGLPRLTSLELARSISVRSIQLSEGSPSRVAPQRSTLHQAFTELVSGEMPLILERFNGVGGEFEIWNLREMLLCYDVGPPLAVLPKPH